MKWPFRLLVFAGIGQRAAAGGGLEEGTDVIQGLSAVGTEEAVISDFDETLGQHVLEESSDEFFCRKSHRFPLSAAAGSEAEGHLSIFELFDAVVGDGDSPDVRGQVFDDL